MPTKSVANPGRRGPKSRFTPEVERDILAALATGVPIKLAAQSVGVAAPTVHGWMVAHPEFGRACDQARGRAAVRNMLMISKAAPNDWRAAAKALELSWPDLFGRITHQHVSVNMRLSVAALSEIIAQEVPDVQQRQRLAARILDAGAAAQKADDTDRQGAADD